jgi:hypothetical protein
MVYSCAYFENGDEDLHTAQLKNRPHGATLAKRAGAAGINDLVKKPLKSHDITVSLAHRARLARLNET